MKIKLYCNESRHLVFYIILIFIQTNFLIMVQSFFTNRIFFCCITSNLFYKLHNRFIDKTRQCTSGETEDNNGYLLNCK